MLPELEPINSQRPFDILYPEEDPLYPQVRHVPVVEHDRHVNFMLPLLPTNKLLQLEHDVAVPPKEYVPAEQLTHEEPLIYCPGSHEMFALDPVHTPVVVQLVQVRLLPTYKVEQDLQADAFVVVEYVPVEHVRQLDPLRYVPAEHVGEQFPFSDTDPVGSAKANFCIVP